jgi:hypothetical protein
VLQDYSVNRIVDFGFDRPTVVRVLQMVKRAAFGRDWRYAITSGY